MNPTAWVAIAGIAGTVLAAVLGPFVAEKMRRKSAREELKMSHRVVAYADLLRATARFADNASTWSAIPLADLKEIDGDELDRLMGQVRVLASDAVRRLVDELAGCLHQFNRDLYSARVELKRARDEGHVDTASAIEKRFPLADMANRVADIHRRLERAIRDDMGT